MQQVPLTSPIKGVVRSVAREGQPPETCWDALNCVPYDRYGRKRLSQRTGLKKQYPNQMSANFVQGMIEAPNIIYPPGSVTVPLGSVTNLQNPFTFTDPTPAGPFSVPYPTASVSLTWEWDFSITFGSVASPIDPLSAWQTYAQNYGASPTAPFAFYWKMNDAAGGYLILQVQATCALTDSTFTGSAGYNVSVALYTGNPNDHTTWSAVFGAAMSGGTNPVGGQTSISQTFAVTLTISTSSLTLACPTMFPPTVKVNNPLVELYFPELAATAVGVGSANAPTNATVSSTFTVSD